MHYDIDDKPIPEEALYINDPFMTTMVEPYCLVSDYQMAQSAKTKAEGGILPNDNIRVYVPMDLNHSNILKELSAVYELLGSPNEENELDFFFLTNKIMQKLEIYDQIWVTQDPENTIRMKREGIFHSQKGMALVKEIIAYLEKDEGLADMFPFEIINQLKEEWEL